MGNCFIILLGLKEIKIHYNYYTWKEELFIKQKKWILNQHFNSVKFWKGVPVKTSETHLDPLI